MSTLRQIDANRKNAEKSSGPKTLEGKAVSRGNALKHGLSGDGVAVLPAEAERLEQRLVEWRPSFENQLDGSDAAREFLFKQVVLNSMRMETAQNREFEIHHAQKLQAVLNWDFNRNLKAAALGAELSKKPGLTLAKLHTFLQGCEWLIAQWIMLRGILQGGEALNESQVSRLDDLLGVSLDFRGAPKIDDAEALSIIESSIEALEGDFLESRRALDLQDRVAAENGYEREISREERLNRRYEDLATRRFDVARKELAALGPLQPPVEATPALPEPEPVPEPSADLDDEAEAIDPDFALELQIQAKLRAMGLPSIQYDRNEPNGALGKMGANGRGIRADV